MESIKNKLSNPIVISSIIVALLLVAGIVYVATAYFGLGKPSSSQTTVKTSTAKVAPEAIQQTLKAANDSVKQEVDLHNNAKLAVDEQQKKLVK